MNLYEIDQKMMEAFAAAVDPETGEIIDEEMKDSFELDCLPEDAEKYQDMELDLKIEKHRNHRSLDANAMLWACLGELATAMRTDSWSMYLYMLERYGKFTLIQCRPEAVPDL